MKNKYSVRAVVVGIALACGINVAVPAFANSPSNADELTALAHKAVSADTNIAATAIAALRARGPTALQVLLAANADPRAPLPDPQAVWQRLQTALTGVSGQRDAATSMLYWYTDFDQAKATARASGKPILSLRLLGRLDEEFSCANSRFFRTTLYANAEVSQYLRDHFILHWKSVRPVPRITVDFGDGRKIERTLAGNSIHYILDAEGRPIDALPGLYGPKAFLKGLAEAEMAALTSASLTSAAKDEYLRKYHNDRYAAILQSWQNDLNATGNSANSSIQTADEAVWVSIANLHFADAQLDQASRALIESKHPTAMAAGRVAVTKARVENPLALMMSNLQRSIAEDTVRNEYLLHSQIHQWFGSGAAPQGVEQLNARVYANLFLTPDSDPWLGLAPADTFTGLENNGLVQTTPTH